MQSSESAWSIQINKIAQYLFIFFAFCIPMSLAFENTGFVLTLLFALLSGLSGLTHQNSFEKQHGVRPVAVDFIH